MSWIDQLGRLLKSQMLIQDEQQRQGVLLERFDRELRELDRRMSRMEGAYEHAMRSSGKSTPKLSDS